VTTRKLAPPETVFVEQNILRSRDSTVLTNKEKGRFDAGSKESESW